MLIWLFVGRNSNPSSSHGVSNCADPGTFAGVATCSLLEGARFCNELPQRRGVVVDADGWKASTTEVANAKLKRAPRSLIDDPFFLLLAREYDCACCSWSNQQIPVRLMFRETCASCFPQTASSSDESALRPMSGYEALAMT